MGITHAFVSGKADGADTSLVRPSNWNAAHVTNLQADSGTRTAGDLSATAGGALADATDVTVTLTLPSGTSGKVEIKVNGSWHGSVGGGAEFAILVDGTVKRAILDTLSSNGGNQPVYLIYLATGLAAGAHTVKLQWRAITSDATLLGGTVATRNTTIVATELL